MNLSKKDIVWSYFAQLFSIASGILVLPLILRLLTPEEIGMNYLMLTVGSMVSLFDFGFAPQFGRNFSYIFGGAQMLKKEGIDYLNHDKVDINYKLLATMIHTAKTVYRILSFIVLFVMLSLGTLYIHKITNGFTNVKNSLVIWIIYSISTFFNIYFTYYSSLLTGKGLIMESKKAMVYSKIAYIAITIILLLLGVGLIGVVLANFVAPFVSRFLSHRYFFTKELTEQINCFNISKKEKTELFTIIWYNAKKLGLVFIGSYAINKLSMFLAGLYLSLEEIASYGLMMQLVGIITGLSTTLFYSYQPQFASLRIQNERDKLIRLFAFSMSIFYLLFIIGGLGLIITGPILLTLIKSNAHLPELGIISLYLLIVLLENNHSNFAVMIVTNNSVPFVFASLFAGGLIATGSYLSLSLTELGILGLILVQGFSQIIYNNWKWPLFIFNEFDISLLKFIEAGFIETNFKLKTLIYGSSKQ